MKGQVAIIVLLVSAVMLTMGLSLSRKETTEIKINTNDELLKKAFDTAESGINYYLGTGNLSYSSPDNNSSALINAAQISNGTARIDFGEYTVMGAYELYWLVDHLADGSLGTSYFAGPNIDICSDNYTGALAVDYFYKVGANFNLKRNVFNINNNCTTMSVAGGNAILVSISPINGGGKFYVKASNGGSFSSQGLDIMADGQSGGANKKISIRQRYVLPAFLLSGMTAEGSILNN